MNLGQIKGNCAAESPYTGIGSCAKQEGKVFALIITGVNTMFPIAELEKNFTRTLETGVSAEGSSRIFPIKDIVGMTLAGGDINAPDLGTYGGPTPTNLNAKNVAYQVNAGDCLYKELAKFNKRRMRVFRVDDEGFVYGTVVQKNGADFFAGFETTLYALRTPTDGATAYNLSLFAYYTPNNETEEKNMHAISIGLASVPDGLIGVVLKKGAKPGVASVVTVCGGEDVTADFGDKWKVEMFVNAAGAAPTAVTFDEATGLLTFTPVAAYRLAGASVLSAGDVPGMDGVNQHIDLA